MSDMNEKESGISLPEDDLTADELAASLNRQISGLEEIPTDPDTLIQELQKAMDDELAASRSEAEDEIETGKEEIEAFVFPEETVKETEEQTSAEIEEDVADEELKEEFADDLFEDSIDTAVNAATEIIENAEKTAEKTLAEAEAAAEVNINTAEAAAEESVDTAETAAEESVDTAEAAVAEAVGTVEEIVTEADNNETEEVEETTETAEGGDTDLEDTEEEPVKETVEEAFDKEDTGILDVSQGVLGVAEASTEELPQIPVTIPAAVVNEQPVENKVEDKEEKKRLKREAQEAKAREKQEAKERKRQEKEEKKAKKKKGPLRIFFLILLLLIAATAVVYLALSNRYKTIFFDGTKINGADCTGLTVEEAETVIARQMDDYELTLIFRDGKKEVISGESIGFEYVSDGSVQEIKDSQVPIMWATAFFEEYSYTATAACSFDTAKLQQVITGLEECNLVNMQAPENAYVTYNAEKKTFEIVPEKNGNKFNLSALIDTLQVEILNGTREINVEELGLYENPERKADDAELIKQRDGMNDSISSSITYTLPNGENKVLDAQILSTWISQDEQGNYYVDNELWGNHIANFVEDLAKLVNTSDTTAEFKTHSGGTVTLENYLQGWIIDEEGEGEKLTQELAERAVTTREPVYAQRAYSNENNGIGNTYVEVDLSAQHLWVYENGSVIIESDVVSGMMVTSRYTPEGIYPLYGKQAGRWLRGYNEDGSLNYESWVDYWMPFNGGIGLHDASWRGEFGGSTYIGGGSHGCVNLPVSKAAAIFDWISSGTPVICYYSGGCSVSPDGTYGEE